ncbi:putative acetamidase [Microdochium trichocladiopsis]|uniref:amidase n=1 Tax=Microdochium trichocladiopsis TaxID=1682393 RepID=A0A9P8XYW4_9PEZI|nr:putative acetamidase [Microdochium trichocladiopsis]KAH7025070.1 putative acetamidase [Microdochium trichocladiopsis]
MAPSEKPAWKLRAAQKRAEVHASIPAEYILPASILASPPKDTLQWLRTSGILDPTELEITETTSAPVLLDKLATGVYTAVQVLRAFFKRAALAQQLIGCCTEMFFPLALRRAEALDEYYRSSGGKAVGPLHGLPVSLKDLLDVKGVDSTEGWVGQIGKPKEKDCGLVEVLRGLGAVMYVKTNISQSIMMADSYNHVFLQSLHPRNRELISGGSSGGEGALVGSRASVIGFGTDTGGSVRIPSHLQGCYGLAPTVGRLAFADSAKARRFIAPPVVGPIASSLATMECVLAAYLGAQPWLRNPEVYPIPWRKELADAARFEPEKGGRKLRIGWYLDDGKALPQPPVTATVRRVIGLLRTAGHEVIEWSTAEHEELWQSWGKAIMDDGGKYANDSCALSGEPLIEGMIVGTDADLLSQDEAEALADLRVEHQKAYLKRWSEARLDALVTPIQPWTGLRRREWVRSEPHVGLTCIWNWLGFAALAVPVGVVDEENVKGDETWTKHQPRNNSDKINYESYDPALVMGQPVGVQVVGGRFGEEQSIAVAKVIEKLLAEDNAKKA